MPIDKVKRALIWLRTAFRITDKTTLPGDILGEIRPGVDVFGWDRLNNQSAGPGTGPRSLNANGALTAQSASFAGVPEGTMRYIISASWQTDDPAQAGFLTCQIVKDSIAIAVQEPFLVNANAANVRIGLQRHLVLEPGDVFQVVSSTAPAVGQRLSIRARFVDIDFGEYLPPIS